MNEKYKRIIDLPRPKSRHPHMSPSDRAAQFSPFAALTGHREAIYKTEENAATGPKIPKIKMLEDNANA